MKRNAPKRSRLRRKVNEPSKHMVNEFMEL